MDRVRQYLDFSHVWDFRGMFLDGLWTTLALALATLLLSVPPAIAVALGRRFGPRWLAKGLGILINLSRSVPTVLTVVFIYLALPFVGITFSGFTSVLIALTVMQIVYFSEVFRAALASVRPGQYDAATALGLPPVTALLTVILPQAAVVAAPPFASSLVLLVQNTSIASAIAVNDLITAALAVQNITGQPSPLVAAALGYIVIILPMVRLTRRWERSMSKAL